MATDIMIDLETTGVEAGCCVLSLGACTLDGAETFYSAINHADSLASGLVDLPATMAWWSSQLPEVREMAFSGSKPLIEVMGEFADWLHGVEARRGEAFVWGNGADFDLPILGAAYSTVGMKKPWKPYNGRCFRTFKNIPQHKGIKPDPFLGSKHNALSDAMNQAAHMMKILRATSPKQS